MDYKHSIPEHIGYFCGSQSGGRIPRVVQSKDFNFNI